MTPEAYVIGSVVLSVIAAAFMYGASGLDPERCPRCGAKLDESMESDGGSAPYGMVKYVVPPPLVIRCPQCGYAQRYWA